ncbi:MAG TPA: FGGY-family carbohydrate kinase, partial [Gaiellaceae bacterium]|nr:FGGY-family carbohydrate kinase [Gaiellaceae bacterium]
ARGSWIGLDFSHTRGDLVRAALESVAFEYAGFLQRALQLYPETVPLDVRVIGGGSDDRLWNGIKAAALDLSYVRLQRESFSCWGSALVAAAAVGAVDDLGAAALTATAERERVDPDPTLRSLYAGRLRDYRNAVDLLAPSPQEVNA